MHEFIQEVEYSVSLGACDRLDLDPLGELVDGHQYSVESTWHSWQQQNVVVAVIKPVRPHNVLEILVDEVAQPLQVVVLPPPVRGLRDTADFLEQ
jgi:hypothetical protein